MLVSCQLCGPEDENTKKFEESELLREHLLEVHSKTIARAFLCPDAQDSNHIWLLGCVQYKTSESDSGNASPSDGPTPSSSPDNNLVEVLAAILSTATTTDTSAAHFDNVDMSPFAGFPRKRSASREDSEDVKRAHVEYSAEFLPTVSDPSMYFENAKEIASASGLIQDENLICQSCRVSVSQASRHRHVLDVHVCKKDMFSCSECVFSHPSSVQEVRSHVSAEHPTSGAYAMSNELKYRTLIQQWMRRCFTGKKMSKTESRKIKGNEEDETDYSMKIENDQEMIKEEENDEGMSSDGEEQEYMDKSQGGSSDDRTCHLCQEECRYPGRHIAQKHLRKPLYECPICEGFGSYESCTVVKHMNKVHPEVEGEQPVSNLERFKDELLDLQLRCFPNRPMKLVRANNGQGKPRERHLCKLCDQQVAQSDRQRHVYHRHLQKSRIFECPLCTFASNYDLHRVKWHIKWMHKDECAGVEPVSHESDYRDEIDSLNEQCFPGWHHRRKPFWWLENDEANARIEQAKAKMASCGSQASSPSIADAENLKECSPGTSDETSSQCSRPRVRNDFACRFCKKEFKPSSNFLRHVAKEHLSIPLYQCPVCEGVGSNDAYEMRGHIAKYHPDNCELAPVSNLDMKRHGEEIQKMYSECFPGRRLKSSMFTKQQSSATPSLSEVKTVKAERAEKAEKKGSKSQSEKIKKAQTVNKEKDKANAKASNETTDEDARVTCTICNMDMKTEDRQIHVYRHHLKEPRLYECPVCDFSHHACSSDVRAHIRFVHRDQPNLMPRANLLEFSEKISEWNDKCFPGWINRRLPASAQEDFSKCRLCLEDVRQTSRHIAEVHLNIPLHQCPLCEYGAAESRLVTRHLKNNHKKKDIKGLEPIANVVVRRAEFSVLHDKCFPGRPKRLSNITISDEGRRAKCKGCGMTISKKRRLIHILEMHLGEQVFKCSGCDFTHTFDETAVSDHLRNESNNHGEVVSEVDQFRFEIVKLGKNCFPDWEINATELASA